MRILVTGATGVIGRRVVPLLLADGHGVTACGRNPERLGSLARAGAATLSLDLLDPAATARAVAGHDAVVNLATHMPASTTRMMLPWAWRENDRIRRDGSAILADAALAAGTPRFIQESFGLLYVDQRDRWIDEQSPVRAARYNRSTLDAERSAQRFTERGGDGIVLRFAGFYGPDARFLDGMIALVQRGWAPLPGAPDAYFSSISHDDAARAVMAVLQAPPGIYNVADDEPLTRREFADALASACDVPPPRLLPRLMQRMMGSAGELLSRSERIGNRKLRALGWEPIYRSAREGLADALRPNLGSRRPALGL